jgi:hypothetical protein
MIVMALIARKFGAKIGIARGCVGCMSDVCLFAVLANFFK